MVSNRCLLVLLLLGGAVVARCGSGPDLPDVGVFSVPDGRIRILGADADGGVDADVGSGDADDGGPRDVGPADIGSVTQAGPIVLTEYMAEGEDGFDWIEVENTGPQPVDLKDYGIEIASLARGRVSVFATTDPDGDYGENVTINPGEHKMGVPNPMNSATIPAETGFLFGTRGSISANALDESGDVITLWAPGNTVSDRLDFRDISSTASMLGPESFPQLLGRSTQLDPSVQDPRGNDSGGAWCTQVFAPPTPGAENLSCAVFVISEVLYDFASFAGGTDNGNEFVEIAGPAGGSLGNLIVRLVEGNDPPGQVKRNVPITGTRMPLSGLYVVADDDGTGHTSVEVANQIANLDLENAARPDRPDEVAGDALQLVRMEPNRSPVLLDAFGYGLMPAELVDSTHGLDAFFGTPVPDIVIEHYPSNWARDANATNSRDNSKDFHYDPTPTPGAVNLPIKTAISAISPSNAVATITATVVVSGTDFTDNMTVRFGGTLLDNCRPTGPGQLTCVLPYEGNGTPARIDVSVSTRGELGTSDLLRNAFTWNRANNETNVSAEADYCVIQSPGAERMPISATKGVPSEIIYGQIFEEGVTNVGGGPVEPGVLAELGYGPMGSDPTKSNAWRWFPARLNPNEHSHPNNDEFMASLTIDEVGEYAFTFRFSLDEGLSWTYADLTGAGSNPNLTFNPAPEKLGRITVKS